MNLFKLYMKLVLSVMIIMGSIEFAFDSIQSDEYLIRVFGWCTLIIIPVFALWITKNINEHLKGLDQ